MLANLSLFRTKAALMLAFVAIAFLVLLMSAPGNAHAAAVSLVTATTTSNNASTTLAKVGNTVSFRLVLSGTPAATTTPVINIFSMGTTTMSGSGTAWTYSTTSASSWTSGPISFLMGWGGTVGEATTTISQTSLTNANVRFDKTAPTVTSVTSDASATGVLKVGDTITFTLTPQSTEYGGSVAGSYNGQSLTWSTGDSGVTFTGTYTVTEGDSDQATALQIGAILSDAAGNATTTASSTNVAKTIDANSPATPVASLSEGSYTGSQSTTLTSANSDFIYYTIDGTAPACNTGTLYSGAISLTSATVLKAIGCDNAGNTAASASFTYSIRPTVSGGGGGGGGGSHASGNHTTTVYNVPALTNANPSTTALTNGSSVFSRSLSTGATGADVKSLQVFLNTHGFVIAASGPGSMGNETMKFGALTKAALAKFQASKGISPAVGFFGPLTRAAISATP
jgi:hypothetical protein